MSREEQSPVADMLVTAFLAMLLMIAGIGGAAETDLQVNGKLNDRTLSSREGRQNVRKQPLHQVSYLKLVMGGFGRPKL